MNNKTKYRGGKKNSIKKYTKKRYYKGGSPEQEKIKKLETSSQVIVNNTTNTITNLGDKLLNAVAKSFGYVPIKKDDQNTSDKDEGMLDKMESEVDSLSGLTKKIDVQNIIDKIGLSDNILSKETTDKLKGLSLCFVNKLNNVLEEADKAGEFDVAIEKTKMFMDRVVKGLQSKLNDPDFVASLKKSAENAGDIAEDIVKAAAPQAEHILDELVPIVTKMVTTIIKTMVSITFNTLEDIPGVDIIISLIRDFTAVSLALSSNINSVSMTSRLFNQGYQNTLKNYNKISQSRSNAESRIKASNKEFENTDKK